MNIENNGDALREFIYTHKLMNNRSIVEFMAIVNITTAKNRITNMQIKIMVELSGYDNVGTLSLIENELDPKLYPTVFYAKWQTFQHINNEYFLITDNHKQNPNIGKYEIKIIPLQRTRD